MAATVSISYSDSYNTNRPYIFQRVRYIKKKSVSGVMFASSTDSLSF